MKRTLISLGSLVALAAATLLPAQASEFWQNDGGTLLRCGNPCVVRYSQGGVIGLFIKLGREIRSYGGKLIIDGDCYSACVTLADAARPNTCITKRARFFVHKATARFAITLGNKTYRPGDRLDPIQSADIDAYVVYKRGGYPTKGFRAISYKQALRFWPKC